MDLPSSLTVIGEAVGCRSCCAENHDIQWLDAPTSLSSPITVSIRSCIEGLQSLAFS